MLHQSATAQRRKEVANSGMAGDVVAHIATFDFPAAFTAATDILEISMMPTDTTLLAVELISTLTGVNVATVQLLTGEFGDTTDTDRDVTGAVIATGSVNEAVVKATTANCLAVPRQSQNVGIGIKLSANVAADAGTLTFVMHYAA